ncbi:hypothetical protein, partial [Halorubrum sp. Atlit-9R]|uniref:hypothetical protein n=1 Tax=Halorubrum sp. Atlit-9R TaxID=2282127 RepID=UPI0013141328
VTILSKALAYVKASISGNEDFSLTKLSVGDFKLSQLNDKDYTIGSGFKPNIYSYSIVIPDKGESVTIPINFEKTGKFPSIVKYYIQNGDLSIVENGQLPSTATQFDIQIKPKDESTLWFNVSSQDGANQTTYYIRFQHNRTIQEALSINKGKGYQLTNGEYTVGTYYE